MFIEILQISNLLGCQEPIPIVDLFFTKTIDFDFTYLQTFSAKIRFWIWYLFGLIFETNFKSFSIILKLSIFWSRNESLWKTGLKIALYL